MSGLRGTLEGISLADVLQLLHAHGRTGLLQVHTSQARGVLYLRNGGVIHAETLSAQGEAAALDLLTWRQGSFEFLPVAVLTPLTIHRAVPELLMHSARLEDSRRRVDALLPDAEAVPWPRWGAPRLAHPATFGPEVLKVLPFMDGFRSFLEVAEAAGCHEVEARQAGNLLREGGHLELLRPQRLLRVCARRGRFFHRGDHLELPLALEGPWRALEPYRAGVTRLRVDLPRGTAQEAVRFREGLPEDVLALPAERMVAWDLKDGDEVTVRPAP